MKISISFLSNIINRVFYSNNQNILRIFFYFYFKGLVGFGQKNIYISSVLQRLYKYFFDYPKLLYIHPQKKCNLNCVYCYEKGCNINSKLEFEDYIKIFLSAKLLGISSIHILGGEPFLYDRLFDMLDFLNSQNFSVHIYTNGSLINKTIIKRLKDYNNISILFSLEPEEVYEKICGKDFFWKIIENYVECNKNGISTGILFTLNKINFPYLTSFFNNTVVKYRMNLICERFLPVGNKRIDEECMIGENEWNVFLRFLKKYNRKNRFIPFSELTPLLRGYGCNDFYESIHIDTDGSISPCEYVMSTVKIGNIKDNTLENIWNNYKITRIEWLKKSEECKSCRFSNICGGGCKAYCFLTNGRFDIKDPLCNSRQIPFA